jgi:hypothetical protein
MIESITELLPRRGREFEMPAICECVLSLEQGAGNHEIGYVNVLRFRPCPNQAIFKRCYANVNSFRSGLGRHFIPFSLTGTFRTHIVR